MQAKVFVSRSFFCSRPLGTFFFSCYFGITSLGLMVWLWAAISHFRSFERTTLFGICACVCVSQCSYSIHRAMLILENFKPMDERERNFNGTQNNTTSPVSFELCQRYNSHDQTMFTHRTLFPTPHFLYLFHAFLHKHTAIIPFLPNKKRSTLLK